MTTFRVRTRARAEIVDITPQVRDAVRASGHRSGLAVVYCPHTTAGLSTNENADPDVKRDVIGFLAGAVPASPDFRHAEGNADAHIKTVLTGPSQVFIVEDGALRLGTWQQVWLMEFDGPREREVWVKVLPG